MVHKLIHATPWQERSRVAEAVLAPRRKTWSAAVLFLRVATEVSTCDTHWVQRRKKAVASWMTERFLAASPAPISSSSFPAALGSKDACQSTCMNLF